MLLKAWRKRQKESSASICVCVCEYHLVHCHFYRCLSAYYYFSYLSFSSSRLSLIRFVPPTLYLPTFIQSCKILSVEKYNRYSSVIIRFDCLIDWRFYS